MVSTSRRAIVRLAQLRDGPSTTAPPLRPGPRRRTPRPSTRPPRSARRERMGLRRHRLGRQRDIHRSTLALAQAEQQRHNLLRRARRQFRREPLRRELRDHVCREIAPASNTSRARHRHNTSGSRRRQIRRGRRRRRNPGGAGSDGDAASPGRGRTLQQNPTRPHDLGTRQPLRLQSAATRGRRPPRG